MPLTQQLKTDLLWDKHAVTELMLQFGRALDRKDWSLYETCFIDLPRIDFEDLTGCGETETSAAKWTEFARVALDGLRTHHQYTNHSITIGGDSASSTTYMVARHVAEADSSRWNTQYGWYENEFERCDHGLGWKISKLSQTLLWQSGDVKLIDMTRKDVLSMLREIFGAEVYR